MNNEALYFDTLKRIARAYMTPDQIRRHADNMGLSYTEYLEMAYENIQEEAKRVTKGKRRPKEKSAKVRHQQSEKSGN